MKNVTASEIGINNDQFTIAIQKLENEGLITGAKYTKGGRGSVPLMVFTDFIMVSNYGLEYIQKKLGIQPTMSAGEKVKEVTKKVSAWGYNELKEFTVKVKQK